MYKIMSSYYGQLSAKSTLELAIYAADGYATKAHDDEIISVWANGVELYRAH